MSFFLLYSSFSKIIFIIQEGIVLNLIMNLRKRYEKKKRFSTIFCKKVRRLSVNGKV